MLLKWPLVAASALLILVACGGGTDTPAPASPSQPSQLEPPSSPSPIPSGLGWHELAGTRIDDVCAATHGFAQVWGMEGCAAIESWSGGAFDSRKNRLIVWGGGHNGYYGNELYALDLGSLQMTRLNDPGLPTGSYSTCMAGIGPNGSQANSRHTYDGIEYMPNHDRLFVFNGSVACGDGASMDDTWTFDFSTMAWQRMDPVNGDRPGDDPNSDFGMLTAYDPVTGLVFLHNRTALYAYNYATNRYTRLSRNVVLGYHMTATIDPARRLFVMVGYDSVQGAGRVYTYDISSVAPDVRPGTLLELTQRNTSGGDAVVGTGYPGLDYHSPSGRIVAWNGGNTAYSLDLDANTWTAQTFDGGPGALRYGNACCGTHGRFRYSPVSGAFVVVNGTDRNAYALRLSAAPAGSDADFQARCAASGVVMCEGFDDSAKFGAAVYPASGLYPAGDNALHGSRDTSVKTSGAGSLRFSATAPGANSAGQWVQHIGRTFGENSTFYVQYRYRLSPEMLSGSGGGRKLSIFHYGFNSCADLEITTQNTYYRGFPQMYTDCGVQNAERSANGTLYLQQGAEPFPASDGWNCPYNDYTVAHCWLFQADRWMTLYYRIDIGAWGEPNSRLQAWVAFDGQPLKQFINVPNYRLNNAPPVFPGIDHITLTPYDTGAGSAPNGSVWYDELIVSTQPIASPASHGP